MSIKMLIKKQLKNEIQDNVKYISKKSFKQATQEQIYEATVRTIRDLIMDQWIRTHDRYDELNVKRVYYLSMEFLLGRALSNNLISLSINDEIKEIFEELGIDYNVIEEQEHDAGLGNGGLGRLAACFMDSLTTLKIPAYGCGIRYKYGFFEQKIEDGWQVEYPDFWLADGNPWEVKRPDHAVEVRYYGNIEVGDSGKFEHKNYMTVKAVPYDLPIVGYGSENINTLRLWDAEPTKMIDFKCFQEGRYQDAVKERDLAQTIVDVLYPDDSHYDGKELRLKQQYFFVSATLQSAIKKHKEKNDIRTLADKVVFQLNDTHPSVAVAELMRLLMDEEGLEWEEAWEITTGCCAYTNHTVLAEALEKWPVDLFSKLLPRIYQIIEEINRRFTVELVSKYGKSHNSVNRMAIISDGQVKMAHLAIVGSYSVNGVAALHTEILKNQELKDFYEIFPEKFNNKTNGVTQRRWLLNSNPKLASFISRRIGDNWITNLEEVKKLREYIDDDPTLEELRTIKTNNKQLLANYIKEHNGIDVDVESIFDVQVKRLHEYKRQLLNVLHIMYEYNELKEGRMQDMHPVTYIFGAKSAPSYVAAKTIIKLINDVGNLVNNDPDINGKIKVVFLENYSVSLAEKIFPASDVSEQISTAGKEASGTSNMKFMLNGAITLGTLDGANIEIVEEAGEDNAVIFGLTAEEVKKMNEEGTYNPNEYLEKNPKLKKVIDQLIDGTINKDTNLYRGLYNTLLFGMWSRADEYYVLADFESYCEAHNKINELYKDQRKWTKMALHNIAGSGKFSSDRTITEYAMEIWKTIPIEV